MTQTATRVQPVAVLGAGAWGTALAIAASKNTATMLWARNNTLIAHCQSTRENTQYLSGIALPDQLQLTADLNQALTHATSGTQPGLLILGVPLAGLRFMCMQLAEKLALLDLQMKGSAHQQPHQQPPGRPLEPPLVPMHQDGHQPLAGIVWTCKGLEADSGMLPSEIVREALSAYPAVARGVLSGPSFAQEVAQGLPVALTIASTSPSLREATIAALHGGNVRVYASQDLIGVEVGGALKNVIAIACGISDGLGLGTNARAALITRGLAEIARFGEALGAQASTFSGLTGLGDLVLSATGDLSRNRQVGLAIGQGQTLAHIMAQGLTAEGARCALAVHKRAMAIGVDLPITQAVCEVLFNHVPPKIAVSNLLSRDATTE